MNISDAIVHSYSMLVMRGRCKITDIPEEYRDEVRDYISIDMNEDPKPTPEFVIDDKGPLTLPKLRMHIHSGDRVSFHTDDIFTKDVLKGKPAPDVIKYELIRLETNVAFESEPEMYLMKTLTGLDVKATGKPVMQIKNMPSLVGVIKIRSTDYEDMNLTIYVEFAE